MRDSSQGIPLQKTCPKTKGGGNANQLILLVILEKIILALNNVKCYLNSCLIYWQVPMEKHEINRHWKNIMDSVSEGLMLVGIDGRIGMVNKSFERMTGYKAGETLGTPCTLLNCDACEITYNREGKGWCSLFNMGKDVKKRCVIMRKNGTYLPVLKNASLLKDDTGQTLGAVETFADISEFERLDQQYHQLSIQFDSDEGFQGIIGKSSIKTW